MSPGTSGRLAASYKGGPNQESSSPTSAPNARSRRDDIGHLLVRQLFADGIQHDSHPTLVAVAHVRAGLQKRLENRGVPEAGSEQWCVPRLVTDVDIRPGLQQQGHGLGRLQSGRAVKRGRPEKEVQKHLGVPAVVKSGVHIRPGFEQQGDHAGDFNSKGLGGDIVNFLPPDGVEERRGSDRVPGVHVRSGLQQQGHDLRPLADGRAVRPTSLDQGGKQERCVAVVVARVHIRALAEAGGPVLKGGGTREHLRVPAVATDRIGNLAPHVAHRAIGSQLQQPIGDERVLVGPGGVERCVARIGLCVDFRPGLHQFVDDTRVPASLGSQVKGSQAPLVPDVNIRSGSQEHSHRPGVPAVARRDVQGSFPAVAAEQWRNVVGARMHVGPSLQARCHVLRGRVDEEGGRVPYFAGLLCGGGMVEEDECQRERRREPCDHLHSLQPIPD